MFREGTTDRWYWSSDLHEGVDFCVWVLVVDGLHVPPFDCHPGGDGRLQAAGLEPEAWRAWLEEVIDLDARFRARLPGGPGQGPLRLPSWPRELFLGYSNPPALWPPGSAVGVRLAELWDDYRPRADAWKRHSTGDYALPPRLPPHLAPRRGRDLWRALEPLHGRLPTLHVYVTGYPWPVTYPVRPISVMLGTDNGALGADAYAASVLRAAQKLASLH